MDVLSKLQSDILSIMNSSAKDKSATYSVSDESSNQEIVINNGSGVCVIRINLRLETFKIKRRYMDSVRAEHIFGHLVSCGFEYFEWEE